MCVYALYKISFLCLLLQEDGEMFSRKKEDDGMGNTEI